MCLKFMRKILIHFDTALIHENLFILWSWKIGTRWWWLTTSTSKKYENFHYFKLLLIRHSEIRHGASTTWNQCSNCLNKPRKIFMSFIPFHRFHLSSFFIVCNTQKNQIERNENSSNNKKMLLASFSSSSFWIS